MTILDIARLRKAVEGYFPERHLYVRSGGEVRSFVLSPAKQMTLATAIAVCALWMGVSTAAMVAGTLSDSRVEKAVSAERARAERRIADREARLNSAVAQLSDTNGSTEMLAQAVEKRQAALASLLGGTGVDTSAVTTPLELADATPAERIQTVSADTDRLIDQAETFAKTRADRLRLALRLAGLNPSAHPAAGAALGGPLISASDPRALAAVLDVDEEFARRIQKAAGDLSDVRAMNLAAADLPLAAPTQTSERSSGFGVRLDPISHLPAFHAGLDFPAALRTPVFSTGPGIISYVGERAGYGMVVEIDHGGGFKTRYAHLSSALVTVGQRVAIGQRIAATGDSGRSTGPHLHYEVWVNGRAQNPDRFLKAGSYVHQVN